MTDDWPEQDPTPVPLGMQHNLMKHPLMIYASPLGYLLGIGPDEDGEYTDEDDCQWVNLTREQGRNLHRVLGEWLGITDGRAE